MRAGIDRHTGKLLLGWDHCVQSIGVVLSTRVGERVMRRAFGSGALDLQDRNATPRRVMEIYVAVAAALRRWEPGFRLKRLRLVRAGSDGAFGFDLAGLYYPRGHLGDYSVAEERNAIVGVTLTGGFA